MSQPAATPLSTSLCVSVIGPGETASQAQREIAAEVGRLLAQAGVIVVTGGGSGVMAAAGGGAIEAGGIAVGLLPGADRSAAVGPLTVAIPTGLGELRNGLVVRSADAIIAVGGSWGTASEIALAMRTGVPVVVIGGWRYLDDTGEEIEMVRADTARDAVTTAIALARPKQ